ncbi:choice-of-anchor P family protein [Paeniglutamicibacter terrestris]|uniref:Choice-of-anchor G family protein n=1 Tax=Paeniglutamicibacter terrestris TaxID=2723403 RepID=A0ABX1G9K7_9MICC|nr:choice-of-anchor P family protein [Paeniglutamicibacter terrestris]NKG22718.1 hypothetical protein [Paeniglutamicibacter terrestris]
MKRTVVALIGALSLIVAGSLTPSQAAVPSITPAQVSTGFVGIAYGSYIFNSDKSLTSGPTAYSGVSCTAATGQTRTNSAAAVKVPAVGNVGAVTTSVKSLLSTTGKRIDARSTVASTNLLGGLITAGAITSDSSAEKGASGAFVGTNKSIITSLKVLGLPVSASAAPNTIIDLKLPVLGSVGKITLNGQSKQLIDGNYVVSTTALRVQVLKAGIVGVKAGTDINLGVSIAKLTPPQKGYLAGTGFTTQATLLTGLIGSGPTALATVKCGGGTTAANLAGVTVSGLASVGASSTKTSGVLTPALKSSVTNNLVGLNVLNGLIRADAIKAETSASRSPEGGKVTLTDTSTFANLRIAGLPAINASVAPNTVIQVPGLGQVTLHKVSKSTTTITVTMIEIVLKQAVGTLPLGSKILIGYSSSSVRS